MIEQLICRACKAKLNRVNLKVLKRVVIKCPECGEVNEYIYDPEKYVEKLSRSPVQGVPGQGDMAPPDTLKLPKKNT